MLEKLILSSNKACKWFALSIYRIGNGMFSPFSQLHSCNALDRASHTSRRHFAALFLSFQMSALTVHPKYSIWFSVYRVITNLSSLLYHIQCIQLLNVHGWECFNASKGPASWINVYNGLVWVVLKAFSKRVLFPEFTGPLMIEYCGTSFRVVRKVFSSLERLNILTST